MKENELEIELVCTKCRRHYTRFSDLNIFKIPMSIVAKKKIRTAQLRCPYCGNNKFILRLRKDRYHKYE